ncbi:1182_t:CDS:2, partial [Ambispora gerdemannii]
FNGIQRNMFLLTTAWAVTKPLEPNQPETEKNLLITIAFDNETSGIYGIQIEANITNDLCQFRVRMTLWEKIQQVWKEVDVDYCNNLIRSMPERIRDVIEAQSGYTKW